MSRRLRPKVGQIIDHRGNPIDITQIRIDQTPAGETAPAWWGGGFHLTWGAIVRPGVYRLVLNDGKSGFVVVDELKSVGDGSEFALFRGDGPPPF
ncbi:MAG TPA: hypothetical protein VMV10_25850 [Pirellulales bacterium]|nr:hypothetical protein [Pirellulales bacterium]